MWGNPLTQAHARRCAARGAVQVGPGVGRLASGASGAGRMAEPAEILAAARLALAQGGPLAGRRVVVTAGGTQEPLDPVRYITNASSGKMGVALAEAARDLGAHGGAGPRAAGRARAVRRREREGAHRDRDVRGGAGPGWRDRHPDRRGRGGRFPARRGGEPEDQEDAGAGRADGAPGAQPGHPGGGRRATGRDAAGRGW